MKFEARQYLVIGLGRFGQSVARELCAIGHEVLAVDRDQNRVEEIMPYVTQAAQADATDEEALSSLDAREFDAAIVAIGSEVRDSILISVLLKEAGVPLVMAKAMDDLHAKILRKVGVDRVIFPEREMGRRIAQALTLPRTLDLMSLSESCEILEIPLPQGWEGKALSEVRARETERMNVLAVARGDQVIPAIRPDLLFEKQDLLLVIREPA